MRIPGFLTTLVLFTFFLSLTSFAVAENQSLTIGSKAPSLDIQHWVSNGKGKFKPVTKFESGNVYVVEFWATWCGPCIEAMPHMSELQEKYSDKNVQFISISDEDLETVKSFLDRNVRGEREKTYGQLTSNYCLTSDPDQSTYNDYMDAANQDGIPTAFIVGKTGVIEWIGHPLEIDEPLQKITQDKWDRDAYLAELKAIEKAQAILEKSMEKVMQQMENGETDEAIKTLDELIAKQADDVAAQLKMIRLELLLSLADKRSAAALIEFAEANKDNPGLLNVVAWTVVEMKMNGQKIDKELLGAAIHTTEMAVKLAPEDGSVLDTLGHLLYQQGQLDRAIEIQTKALKHAADMRSEIEPFLKQMLKEKEAASKSNSDAGDK